MRLVPRVSAHELGSRGRKTENNLGESMNATNRTNGRTDGRNTRMIEMKKCRQARQAGQ